MRVYLWVLIFLMMLLSCSKIPEISYKEALQLQKQAENVLLQNTLTKPGPPQFEIGQKGGSIIIPISSDPKTFNEINVRDGDTGVITGFSFDTLADYDPYKREFIPRLADFKVRYDDKTQTTYIRYTLKNNLYWRNAVGEKVKVTSDDIMFWRYKIQGEKKYNMGYETLFIKLRDGSKKEIIVTKIDNRSVEFAVPAIIANPVYFTNMQIGPKYKYEQLLQKLIDEGHTNKDFRDVFTLDMNPKEVPSITGYMLSEYQPGRYVKFINIDDRDFWVKDKQNTSLPYVKEIVFKIVKSDSTQSLLFKQGSVSAVAVYIHQLSEMINTMNEKNAGNKEDEKFNIYNKGANLGSSFLSFNQNVANKSYAKKWFVQKKFRQAMSSLLPRQKIVDSVYGGLSEPAIYFFAKANRYFDKNISLQYRYNPQKAVELLKEIGFYYKDDGLLYDDAGKHVEFTLNYGTSVKDNDSIANLFEQELVKVGITLNVRPVDFQLLVEKITKTYQWDMIMVALGSNYFPESGPTVWLSNGVMHVWNPSQDEPATQWEAKIDDLYYKGLYTKGDEERKAIYDEFQKIILEQVPLTYITYNYGFSAIRKNIGNVFIDNLNSSVLSYVNHVYIKQE